VTLEVFSTHLAPSAQRPRVFREEMQERFSVGLSIEATAGKPLSAEVSAYCGRSLKFAALRFSAHKTSGAPLAKDTPVRLMVTLQDEGTSFIRQDGRHCELKPGQFCVIDPVRSFHIETDSIRIRTVYLDRARFISAFPEIESLTARPIDGQYGPGAIFRSMLDEMFRIASTLDDDTADSIADALPFVLATALQTIKSDSVPTASRLKMFHKQRIKRYARGSLRDPRLTARVIAGSVGLSSRYICELFSDETLSLMKWVWAERLGHCRRDLQDPALAQRAIGEIAYSWGFSDLAHFSRAFRARFSVSPREFRKTGIRTGS
jgi:AraC family transcriptional regulator, positive regulator of tynA and feaB